MENLNNKRREIVIICVHGGDDCAKKGNRICELLEDRKVYQGSNRKVLSFEMCHC